MTRTLLRCTRRGWMMFRDVDDGAAGAGSGAAADAVVDYKAKLLALLGLDESADAATIDAKVSEISTTLGGVGELQTKASTAEQLQQQYNDLEAQYAELNKKQQEIYRQKQEAEADEILKVYEGHFVDDASKSAIRNILLSDKDAGIAILNGLKKPETQADPEAAAAANSTTPPPAPTHDPKKQASGPGEEEIAKKVSARAAELGKKFPKKSTSDLFAQAEKEIRKELSAAASA